MKNTEFVYRLKNVLNLKTHYVMGGYGARLGKDYVNYNKEYNKEHRDEIESFYNTDPITYAFDCVCLIKAVLFWRFSGDPLLEFGGSKFDKSTDFPIATIKKNCTSSNDFENIEIGEILFIGTSHVGVYIGNGEVIECTPAWANGVQRTLLPWRNTTNYEKLPVRTWETHGRYNMIEYPAPMNTNDSAQIRNELVALKNENRILKDKIAAALGVLK